MSYQEENGTVVLRTSREDYDYLLHLLDLAAGATYADTENITLLVNRLNEGNPNYTPYQVGK